MSDSRNLIHGRQLMQALLKAGVINDLCQRVVIDVSVNDLPRIYTEQVGSKNLIDVAPSFTGLVATRIAVVPDSEEKDDDNSGT